MVVCKTNKHVRLIGSVQEIAIIKINKQQRVKIIYLINRKKSIYYKNTIIVNNKNTKSNTINLY